jgi:hypothetical protein
MTIEPVLENVRCTGLPPDARTTHAVRVQAQASAARRGTLRATWEKVARDP